MAASIRAFLPATAACVAAVMACACARAAELPKSPACRSALQALDQEEARMASEAAGDGQKSSGGVRQQLAELRLKPVRERVARECLGGLTSGPPPSQHTWVAPPAVRPTPGRPIGLQPAPVVPTTPVVPAPRLDPPLTITHCNAGTCQASDGSTLTRLGPTLIGPRGNCTMQGVFLKC